ncbi:hypothetical protein ARMGADRAFT_1062959 [Armillaria gallica]|uniref:Uncharacterized protein n=1 Tax=Armillaria gallica TaxID=47427 RepID=A0A2H3DEA3_ARMGA|nr:hypothetical protein ARMGADRAFT_1062959 [Armillaria gallica]
MLPIVELRLLTHVGLADGLQKSSSTKFCHVQPRPIKGAYEKDVRGYYSGRKRRPELRGPFGLCFQTATTAHSFISLDTHCRVQHQLFFESFAVVRMDAVHEVFMNQALVMAQVAAFSSVGELLSPKPGVRTQKSAAIGHQGDLPSMAVPMSDFDVARVSWGQVRSIIRCIRSTQLLAGICARKLYDSPSLLYNGEYEYIVLYKTPGCTHAILRTVNARFDDNSRTSSKEIRYLSVLFVAFILKQAFKDRHSPVREGEWTA